MVTNKQHSTVGKHCSCTHRQRPLWVPPLYIQLHGKLHRRQSAPRKMTLKTRSRSGRCPGLKGVELITLKTETQLLLCQHWSLLPKLRLFRKFQENSTCLLPLCNHQQWGMLGTGACGPRLFQVP